ncbi:putative transcriptional regulator [Frankia canadensis]|uniref:Putative transcriptional regulator n=1 Tax=Frankia canadensis TaxID=1836972 RepID=A0A2I2KMZ8_9ACTN|nr:WYL domain-containing protein [Frankia canadensis]SNQ47047.1 putative transcriptional regulator [Frankia canadensis]SOU54337.1 putative transcriptional regulator [Frankia canadensis]
MPHPDRLTAIVEELRRAGPAGRTAASLAARLDVSVRTIRRDLLVLQGAGVPVGGISGPGGGYVLAQHAMLPPVALTQGQATAAAVALAAASTGPLTRDGAAALEKLLDTMPPAEQKQVAEVASRGWAAPPAVIRSALAATVEEALRGGQILVIDYQDAAGSRTVGRRVEPHLLAFTGGQWYLLAWCLERRGPRWFRWDRISRAVNTGQQMADRDPFALFTAPPPGPRRIRRAPAQGEPARPT